MPYEDHHYKSSDGKFQHSPPKELRTLYDYLPTDDSPLSAQYKTPSKLTLEAQINTLRQQSHCLGTYVRLRRGRNSNPRSVRSDAL